MKKHLFTAIAAVSLPLAMATTVHARVIELTPGQGDAAAWSDFVFEGVDQPWDDEFHFTLSASAELQITDAYFADDILGVTINGVDKGATSAVAVNDAVNYQNFYENAYNSTLFSHGSWDLGPGEYTVTGTALVSPFLAAGAGAGARLVEIPAIPTDPIDPPPISPMGGVPEPASWALMISGFVGVGGALRTRRRWAMSEA